MRGLFVTRAEAEALSVDELIQLHETLSELWAEQGYNAAHGDDALSAQLRGEMNLVSEELRRRAPPNVEEDPPPIHAGEIPF